MNDSKAFKLPPEVIQQLTRRSDAKGLAQLAAHLFLLVLAGIALQASWDSLWLLLTLPAYSALLIFLPPSSRLSLSHTRVREVAERKQSTSSYSPHHNHFRDLTH